MIILLPYKYRSKRKQKILILIVSLKHKSWKVENSINVKSETITYYNNTKFSVDKTDEMTEEYSIKLIICRRNVTDIDA